MRRVWIRSKRKTFYSLTGHALTKNLKYLNAIIKSGFMPDLAVVKELGAAILENGVAMRCMKAVSELLREPAVT